MTLNQISRKRKIFLILALPLLSYFIFLLVTNPSNDLDWSEDQAVLAYAEIKDNKVEIKNIRNFTYRSETDYSANYYDKTFDLEKLQTLDFIVEPFSEWDGAAHTFLSFGFEGDEYLSVSVEIRKEKGEEYSPFKGLFRQYEIMYVIADENDVVKLRSNHRKNDVYIYPAKVSAETIQKVFLDILNRVNHLKDKPEFYNTLTNTCTTNIVRHINTITPKTIPWNLKVLFPGYSDRLAYDLDLIDTDLTFGKIRDHFRINERALEYKDSPDFSVKIRQRD